MLRLLKTVFAGLLGVALVAPALAARVRPAKPGVLPLKLELPSIPPTFSMPFYPERIVEWNTKAGGVICGGVQPRWYFHGCGVRMVMVESPDRPNRLADPLVALGEAYLKCRAIQMNLLEPAVHVASYPAGYFGDWVKDGCLVREREETSDEGRMRELFGMLAECVMAPSPDDEYWVYEAGFVESANDYRRDAGSSSRWTIEFAGEIPLRLEFDPVSRRLLVEAGERWDSYELDATRAGQLQGLLDSRPF